MTPEGFVMIQTPFENLRLCDIAETLRIVPILSTQIFRISAAPKTDLATILLMPLNPGYFYGSTTNVDAESPDADLVHAPQPIP